MGSLTVLLPALVTVQSSTERMTAQLTKEYYIVEIIFISPKLLRPPENRKVVVTSVLETEVPFFLEWRNVYCQGYLPGGTKTH